MINTMIVGWILTWFNLDDIITEGINQIFNTNYTTSIYWLMFFVVGLILLVCFKMEE